MPERAANRIGAHPCSWFPPCKPRRCGPRTRGFDGLKERFMGNRFAYRAFAKMPALALLLAGAHLGCSGNAQTGSGEPGTESTNTSDQPLLSAEADHETCDGDAADPPGDPPGDPSPSDCGARTTTACRVTSGFRTFRSLQAAINA